jgi:excisionase family DNA binding protein
MSAPAVASPYLTARETIAYLKLGSRSALQRLIVEHRLPYCRRGRLYLFDTRELDAWLHGHGSALERTRALRRGA